MIEATNSALLVGNPIGFRLSYITTENKKLTFKPDRGKVLAFEILNEGTNSNLLIGKDGVFICITDCSPKSFGLDSWFFYCDYLEYKFETIDENLPVVHKGVLFEKYLKNCCD